MSDRKVIISSYNTLTAYGFGADTLYYGLYSGQTALRKCMRLKTESFLTAYAGEIASVNCDSDKSLIIQMAEQLVSQNFPKLPEKTLLIFASTTGEIDLLEKNVNDGTDLDCSLSATSKKLRDLFGSDSEMVVSAACASGTAAVARAHSLIKTGVYDSVLIFAADCISEFVFSGFTSLRALDPEKARPFDAERAGLSIGEAAGYILMMSEEKAAEVGVHTLARVSGVGQSNDANHMTGPSRDGEGLARAITKALRGCNQNDIAFIAAHGTGTRYNDSMELKAFKSCFDEPHPTFSIKGGTGHTMGSAGLLQLCMSIECLKRGTVLPTVGLENVDEEATEWVSLESLKHDNSSALVVNAGFAGINAAVTLTL